MKKREDDAQLKLFTTLESCVFMKRVWFCLKMEHTVQRFEITRLNELISASPQQLLSSGLSYCL